MFGDGQEERGVFDPALLRLLGLARRISGGYTPWLFLNGSGGCRPRLFGEHGLIDGFAGAEASPWEIPAGRVTADRCSPVLRDLAKREGLFLVAGVAVTDGREAAGVLLLAASDLRKCSSVEWGVLDDLAAQATVALERNRLAAGLEWGTTADRTAKELLGELRGDLRLVSHHVLEVLCKTDLAGNVWLINPSAEKILGYGQGELAGRNVLELVHPEDRPAAEEAFRKGRATGRFEIEVRCQHRDGSSFHFVCCGAALQDDNRLPTGFLLAGRDISRRRKAEEDLRRLERSFRLVWENSKDAMRLIDSDGFVVQVNDAYCRLVEKPREELVAQPFLVAYGCVEAEKEMEGFRERFASRTIPPRMELELTLWNGTRRVFDLSSSFFEADERPLLLTTFRDITNRRDREAEMEKLNEVLRQRAAHLGSLTLQLTRAEQQERRRLAETIHDHLQQLLVAARMTIERVRQKIPPGEVAETAAEVEHLIDESIAASRSITTELSPPVLREGGLIAAIEWLARRVKTKYDLQVTLTADPAAEPPSDVLRLFLFQAVRELLFNCFKHAGVSEVAVSVEAANEECVRITVRDRGAGFDAARVRDSAGSSDDCFGLFSLGERIDHIGGSMEIDTAPGKGTLVTLVAPLEPKVAVPSREEPVPVRHSGMCSGEGCRDENQERFSKDTIRLLLVDDHKIMRQGLRELLREQPDMLVVGEAENGLEGVRLAQELQPDVVVMDIGMPVMNGVEAARVLSFELPAIKVIGLSMHVKEDMAQAMLEAGACAYVTKSTASDTLTETIRECLGLISKD